MVPKNPATRARINRNGSHSSGPEISCDTGFDSCFRRGSFSGSSHNSDLKMDIPVATLPGTWPYKVSAGIGRPGASIL